LGCHQTAAAFHAALGKGVYSPTKSLINVDIWGRRDGRERDEMLRKADGKGFE
jgi:hypothetical protein